MKRKSIDRGNISRPTVIDVMQYRKYVDDAMINNLQCNTLSEDVKELLILGFNHEEQHQELLKAGFWMRFGWQNKFILSSRDAILRLCNAF